MRMTSNNIIPLKPQQSYWNTFKRIVIVVLCFQRQFKLRDKLFASHFTEVTKKQLKFPDKKGIYNLCFSVHYKVNLKRT